ncbi:hypothetical protein DFH05DRAFT_520934 [Lentinula detonsa]|uniref:Uncharacterized protein n=1 Tax=Lentinula detonsa TaxID=2804962 RepID=A0A9W8NRT2_9AGAR|nr:hypothetical protein DFH05DRAFT_520934 [Lentinula detonsa]
MQYCQERLAFPLIQVGLASLSRARCLDQDVDHVLYQCTSAQWYIVPACQNGKKSVHALHRVLKILPSSHRQWRERNNDVRHQKMILETNVFAHVSCHVYRKCHLVHRKRRQQSGIH